MEMAYVFESRGSLDSGSSDANDLLGFSENMSPILDRNYSHISDEGSNTGGSDVIITGAAIQPAMVIGEVGSSNLAGTQTDSNRTFSTNVQEPANNSQIASTPVPVVYTQKSENLTGSALLVSLINQLSLSMEANFKKLEEKFDKQSLQLKQLEQADRSMQAQLQEHLNHTAEQLQGVHNKTEDYKITDNMTNVSKVTKDISLKGCGEMYDEELSGYVGKVNKIELSQDRSTQRVANVEQKLQQVEGQQKELVERVEHIIETDTCTNNERFQKIEGKVNDIQTVRVNTVQDKVTIMTPEKFTVTPFSDNGDLHPVTFLTSFQSYRSFELYDDTEKINCIYQHLRGSARLWGESIIQNCQTYSKFKEKFMSHFWSSQRQYAAKRELCRGRRFQSDRERLLDFFMREAAKGSHFTDPIPEDELVKDIVGRMPAHIFDMFFVQNITAVTGAIRLLDQQDCRHQHRPPEGSNVFLENSSNRQDHYTKHNSQQYWDSTDKGHDFTQRAGH